MNNDNANQVEVGEGPKAADAVVPSTGRAREAPEAEAPEAEAPFDIESVEALLGDLELGPDEIEGAVIGDLSALDGVGECVLDETRKEAMNLYETAHAAVAEVNRIAETEGSQAADAALQRFVRTRKAREAEAREAEAPSDIERVEALLGDLELVADESSSAVVEHVGELDAASKCSIEAAIATAKAYEAQDLLDGARREPTKLQEQMRAARIKYNGDVVAPDDPLAKDKKKADNALKKVGRTLADLPLDWDKLPRITKIPFERSRQSEFYRVFCEGEEEILKAERLHELEKRGRPPNYDLLSVDEQDRIDTNARQRRHRDKKRKPSSKPTVAPPPLANTHILSSGARHGMSRSLAIWARAGSTPLAQQLRKPEQQRALVRAAAAYAWYFDRHSEPPSRSVLAKMVRSTEDQVRRKLDVLKSLYAPGGPWAGA